MRATFAPVSDLPPIAGVLVCPHCKDTLTFHSDHVVCPMGHRAPRRRDTVLFEPPPTQDLHRNHSAHRENAGAAGRIERFVEPLIDGHFGTREGVRLLDDGCGAGGAVEAFVQAGFDAYGIDPGPRQALWDALAVHGRLAGGDGLRLPFADDSFSVVTSSGVLEHVGEGEPDVEREAARARYVEEMLRVLSPDGFALVAFPNGWCPLDFWHPKQVRGLRWHRIPDPQLLPVASDLRRWAGMHGASVELLSPEGYLGFKRVARHWWGRAFTPSTEMLLAGLTRWPSLLPTGLNPFLVAKLTLQR